MNSNLNGLLLIDKPENCTSHDVVAQARRLLNISEIGHTGTLDPIATGLMVLLVGQATKLSQFILSQDKRYSVHFRLGLETDMGDRTGQILSETEFAGTSEQVKEAMARHLGQLNLSVPLYSAVKVDGKRLHSLARQGIQIQTPSKPMTFFDLKCLSINGADVHAEVSCTKGSFIRSWVESIGRDIGCGATVFGLRRLRSEPYSVDQAVELGSLATAEGLRKAFIPLVEALPHWPTYTVRGRDATLLRNGQIAHELGNRMIVEQKRAHQSQAAVGIKVVGACGTLLGILEAMPSKGLKIKRIFPDCS